MKVLCTADIHIGQQAYSKLDIETGLNTRIKHSLDVLDDMVDYAINNCEVFIFAGDMFKNALPTPTIQDEVYKRFKKLSDNKIKTFIIDGNHDVSKLDTSKSSLKAFNTFDLPYITHTKFYKEEVYNGVNFVMLPTYITRSELQNTLKNYTIPTILIGHFTVLGAKLNSWLIDKNEANIALEDLSKSNVKAVVLGHLHKHQILQQEPLVFYTGSPTRIDFGEEEDEKGFVVLDTDDYSYEFIKTNSEIFKTIKIDITELEEEIDVNDYLYQRVMTYDVENAIVRVIVNLNTTQSINEQSIYKTLNAQGAKYITNIQKNYTSKKYNRNSNITSDLSIENALTNYYKGKERCEERIELGKEIIKVLE